MINLSKLINTYYADYIDKSGNIYLCTQDSENPYDGEYFISEIKNETKSEEFFRGFCHYSLIDKSYYPIYFFSYPSSLAYNVSELTYTAERAGEKNIGCKIYFYSEDELVACFVIRVGYTLNEDETEYNNFMDEVEYNGKYGVSGFAECVLSLMEVIHSSTE